MSCWPAMAARNSRCLCLAATFRRSQSWRVAASKGCALLRSLRHPRWARALPSASGFVALSSQDTAPALLVREADTALHNAKTNRPQPGLWLIAARVSATRRSDFAGPVVLPSIGGINDAPMIDYEIKPRPDALGAGWKLVVREEGVEIAGGVFPAGDEGYADALDVATSFLPHAETASGLIPRHPDGWGQRFTSACFPFVLLSRALRAGLHAPFAHRAWPVRQCETIPWREQLRALPNRAAETERAMALVG
jgi:hypothetical protein